MKQVIVVTGLELGWDCVVAVYDSEKVSYEEIVKIYPSDQYVLTEVDLETKLSGFDD